MTYVWKALLNNINKNKKIIPIIQAMKERIDFSYIPNLALVWLYIHHLIFFLRSRFFFSILPGKLENLDLSEND